MQDGEIKINERASIYVDETGFVIVLKNNGDEDPFDTAIEGTFERDGNWMLEDLIMAATRIKVLRDRPPVVS